MDKPLAAGSKDWLADTHQPENLSHELCDYNLYTEDAALTAAVVREGGHWGAEALRTFGQACGRADYLALGRQANQYRPELDYKDFPFFVKHFPTFPPWVNHPSDLPTEFFV